MTFVLFAVTHWLCDLIWLEALSFASFKGAEIFGDRVQKAVLAVCAVALLLFGAKFVLEAGRLNSCESSYLPVSAAWVAPPGRKHPPWDFSRRATRNRMPLHADYGFT